VDVQPQVTAQPEFVTATLAPTQTGLTRATVTPKPTAITDTSPTSISTNTTPVNCKDVAVLLRDVTIPDNTQIKAGDKFIKTWEFQNMGTCLWTNYTVKFSNGDEMHAPLSTPMPDTAPNNKVQVSMELTAPSADGRYSGYFTLNNANGDIVPIGTEKTFWVKFMVGTYASSLANAPQSGNCIQGPNADYTNQIIALINAARTQAGLSTLTSNGELVVFAQHHAEDMAYNNFLSHDGSDGSFGERMMGFSLNHTGQQITGEILAIGTPQDAMDQWHRDEHWDYVLGVFTQIGVGYAYNSCSDYGGYFTVDLSN
jgi:uncharacterized protein YkwD